MNRRHPVVPSHSETLDRRLVAAWMADRTLDAAGRELGRNRVFMSRWFRHEAELRDFELDLWSEVTGVTKRTFMDGRYESRKLAQELAA